MGFTFIDMAIGFSSPPPPTLHPLQKGSIIPRIMVLPKCHPTRLFTLKKWIKLLKFFTKMLIVLLWRSGSNCFTSLALKSDISRGKKQLVSQVLWPLSNISALCYTIDQCLIPMGLILNSKRVIENIKVNSNLGY